MSIVVEVIAEYLKTNRKLVVPSLGAFMVKESGEHIFSDLLSTDDGVLTSLLQARGLNEMETAVTIDRFVFEVRNELEEYGYCRLDVVGTLRVEPDSGVVRLYPQVLGEEEPMQAPYVPVSATPTEGAPEEKIVVEERVEDVKTEPARKVTPAAYRRSAKPRRSFDFVMFIAIVIIVAALAVVAYCWYVSNDATEARGVAEQAATSIEQTINE